MNPVIMNLVIMNPVIVNPVIGNPVIVNPVIVNPVIINCFCWSHEHIYNENYSDFSESQFNRLFRSSL